MLTATHSCTGPSAKHGGLTRIYIYIEVLRSYVIDTTSDIGRYYILYPYKPVSVFNKLLYFKFIYEIVVYH